MKKHGLEFELSGSVSYWEMNTLLLFARILFGNS